MEQRPKLDRNMDAKTLKDYYYLKEELVNFCRENNLQTSGGKIELTERIEKFLATGIRSVKTHSTSKKIDIGEINLDTRIEKNFVCSEIHRAFFKEQIGNGFKFNVTFQKWLKNNSGKTYQEAIKAYYEILEDKKTNKTTIDKQFEYNTYIRDFFHDNKDKSLEQAIKCWKYKKSIKGHNQYEKEDLKILSEE